MIVYVIKSSAGEFWSSKKLWNEFPDIFPTVELAERCIKGTPSNPGKPGWYLRFYNVDATIEIVPYKLEMV